MRKAILAFCGLLLASCSHPSAYGPLPFGASAGSALEPPAGPRYELLYAFTGHSDGEFPMAGLLALGGVLYGTTEQGGGASDGTVFQITSFGSENVVYSFGGSPDGIYPVTMLTYYHNTIYGTTKAGGTSGLGVAFKIDSSGNEHVLHSFGNGSDGARPHSALLPFLGALYGVTYFGGKYDEGAFYAMTTFGTEQVLHSFGKSFADGRKPNGNLVAARGKLYGASYGGGYYRGGTLYSITAAGTEHVLHDFGHGNDGKNPFDEGLLLYEGAIYGTTCYGGTHGYGTVFMVTLSGREKIVYNFGKTMHDAQCPTAGLVAYRGLLYGTTYSGGTSGLGTVYSVTPGGTEYVLHNFAGNSDGALPDAPLTVLNGALYGTTTFGGASYGTVFRIKP